MKKPAGPPAKAGSVAGHPQHAKMTAAQHAARVESAQDAAATRKHNAASGKKVKSSKHGTKRGLTPGDVACCTAEAIAASMRLAGWPCGDADILALYLATPGADERGTSILAALQTAARFGLAGIRPVSFAPAQSPGQGDVIGLTLPGGGHAVTAGHGGIWTWGGFVPADTAWLTSAAEETWRVEWPC